MLLGRCLVLCLFILLGSVASLGSAQQVAAAEAEGPAQPVAVVITASAKPAKIMHHADNIVAASVREGSFEIKSTMPTLPVITCDYRIPLDRNGQPLATANDMVLLFPYPSEKQAIKGIAKNLPAEWGFSTLSLRFPGFIGGQTNVSGNDRQRFYYYPESGAGQAWIDAIHKVREINGLEDRPVIVTGRSGGGSAACLFADAHPEMVCALANESGRVFAEKSAFKGPTLMMYGVHDYVVEPIEAWMKRAKAAGVDVVSYTFAPKWSLRVRKSNWQHPIHGAAGEAFLRWIIDVADMRIDNAQIPLSETWSLQENGIAYSSQAFKDIIDTVIKPVAVHKSDAATVIIADPAPARTVLGTVLMIGDTTGDNTHGAAFDDLRIFAEQVADNGFRCVAISPHNEADDEAAIVAMLLSKIQQFAVVGPYAQLPMIVASENAAHVTGIINATVPQLDQLGQLNQLDQLIQLRGVILLRPRRDLLTDIFAACTAKNLPMQVIASQEQTQQAKASINGVFNVEWSEIDNFSNRNQWHAKRDQAVMEMLTRWAAEWIDEKIKMQF